MKVRVPRPLIIVIAGLFSAYLIVLAIYSLFPASGVPYSVPAEPVYAAYTEGVAAPDAHDAATYLRVLQDRGLEVDAWETTYLHVLEGEDPVFTWVSGTGARPTLQALPGELRLRFEAEFKERLQAAYPADARGRVVLPFRRVFVVAHRR